MCVVLEVQCVGGCCTRIMFYVWVLCVWVHSGCCTKMMCVLCVGVTVIYHCCIYILEVMYAQRIGVLRMLFESLGADFVNGVCRWQKGRKIIH
uniref:Uncharacterized protein n=1 Tax=Pyxicephalus adspersus TaxID=30357 RepID=A0AAV3A595_PYXAD|nr:TPA: hypothetical protein GDO54_015368 [Pyxicephalus adspersus]